MRSTHNGKVEFGAASREDDNLLAAERKHQRDVAHDDDTADEVDFKDAVAEIAAVACVLVIADVMAERRENVFLRAQHAH